MGKKGVGEDGEMDWLMKDICDELRSWGNAGGAGNKIILKSDGEIAMQSLKAAVGKYHGGIIIPEISARGESQSNGAAEQAAQVVAVFVRVLKEQIEHKVGIKLKPTVTIPQWMIRWAAILCSRFTWWGSTEEQHTNGEEGDDAECQLSHLVKEFCIRKSARVSRDKTSLTVMTAKEFGLGIAEALTRILLALATELLGRSSFRRRDDSARWDAQLIQGMSGTSQQSDPNKPGSIIPIRVHFEACSYGEVQGDKPDRDLPDCASGAISRRFRIVPQMLLNYGHTDGCLGCRHKRTGLTGARDHSSLCRRRIIEMIRKDASEIGPKWRERLRDEKRRLVSDTLPSEPDQGGVAVAPPEDLESRPAGDLETVDDGGLHSITGRVVQREPPLCVTHLTVLTQVGAGDTIG